MFDLETSKLHVQVHLQVHVHSQLKSHESFQNLDKETVKNLIETLTNELNS